MEETTKVYLLVYSDRRFWTSDQTQLLNPSNVLQAPALVGDAALYIQTFLHLFAAEELRPDSYQSSG